MYKTTLYIELDKNHWNQNLHKQSDRLYEVI